MLLESAAFFDFEIGSSMSRAENLQDMRAVRTAHRPTSAASITDTSLLAHLGKTIATVIRCYRIVTRLSLQDLADRSSLWTRPMVKNVEFGGRSVFVPEYRHRTCTEYNPRTIVDQSSAVVSSAGVVIDKYRDP